MDQQYMHTPLCLIVVVLIPSLLKTVMFNWVYIYNYSWFLFLFSSICISSRTLIVCFPYVFYLSPLHKIVPSVVCSLSFKCTSYVCSMYKTYLRTMLLAMLNLCADTMLNAIVFVLKSHVSWYLLGFWKNSSLLFLWACVDIYNCLSYRKLHWASCSGTEHLLVVLSFSRDILGPEQAQVQLGSAWEGNKRIDQGLWFPSLSSFLNRELYPLCWTPPDSNISWNLYPT